MDLCEHQNRMVLACDENKFNTQKNTDLTYS